MIQVGDYVKVKPEVIKTAEGRATYFTDELIGFVVSKGMNPNGQTVGHIGAHYYDPRQGWVGVKWLNVVGKMDISRWEPASFLYVADEEEAALVALSGKINEHLVI